MRFSSGDSDPLIFKSCFFNTRTHAMLKDTFLVFWWSSVLECIEYRVYNCSLLLPKTIFSPVRLQNYYFIFSVLTEIVTITSLSNVKTFIIYQNYFIVNITVKHFSQKVK